MISFEHLYSKLRAARVFLCSAFHRWCCHGVQRRCLRTLDFAVQMDLPHEPDTIPEDDNAPNMNVVIQAYINTLKDQSVGSS
jgi:hypothetical protein